MRLRVRRSRPTQAQRLCGHQSRTAISGAIALVAAVLAIASPEAWVGAAPIQTEEIATTEVAPTEPQFPELEEAQKKLQARDVNGALEILRAAEAKYSELPPARAMLGRMLYALNQAAAASSTLELAVVETPDDPEPYLTLGEVALQSQRFTEAGLLLKKGGQLTEHFTGNEVRLKRMRIRVHAGLAEVARTREYWAVAQDHLNAWLELEPENAAARHRMGFVLFGLASSEEDKDKKKELRNAAWEELKTASEADESLPSAAVTMGSLYNQAGNLDSAKQWMDYAAKSAPDDLRTRLGIATWYWQTNQPADAEPHAQAALNIDENSLEAMLLSGLIAHTLKKMDAAERFLNSAHRQSPSNFLATNHLALVLADQNDQSKRRQALELAQVNARQYPRRADAAATLGWILFLHGNSREAAQNLSNAASSGTVTSETAYYLARLYLAQDKPDDAKRFLEMALNAPAPFVHRSDAKEHHDRLASAASSSDGDSTGPPSIVP